MVSEGSGLVPFYPMTQTACSLATWVSLLLTRPMINSCALDIPLLPCYITGPTV